MIREYFGILESREVIGDNRGLFGGFRYQYEDDFIV